MEILPSVIVFQGHCFIAVNPKVYADGFEDRMQASMDQYRNLEPVSVRRMILRVMKWRRNQTQTD